MVGNPSDSRRSIPVQVGVLLQSKGAEVVCVPPDATVREVVDLLAARRIGAVVVSRDGRRIEGVLSERDVVRRLATDGADVLERSAQDLMTVDVVTCQRDTTVEELMGVMTERRIRHVPVVVDGFLAGVVSIGDVVKDRIEFLEHESQVLHDYIANPY